MLISSLYLTTNVALDVVFAKLTLDIMCYIIFG